MTYKRGIMAMKFTNEQIFDRLQHDFQRINRNDLNKIIEKSKKILSMFDSGPLHQLWQYGNLMTSLIKDYSQNRYNQISWSSIAIAAAALIYVLTPLDIIPDFIPGIGQLDDVAIVTLALRFIKEELDRYATWKEMAGPVIDV